MSDEIRQRAEQAISSIRDGHWREGSVALGECLNLAAKGDDEKLHADILRRSAEAAAIEGYAEKARTLYFDALRLYRYLGDNANSSEVCVQLAWLLKRLEQGKKASEYMKLALEYQALA